LKNGFKAIHTPFFLFLLLPNSGIAVNRHPAQSELNKTFKPSIKQKKKVRKINKIKKKFENLSQRKKVGFFILLPILLISFMLLLGGEIGGTAIVGLIFFNLACLLAFIFSMKKSEDASQKVGNTIIAISIAMNLIALWLDKTLGGG